MRVVVELDNLDSVKHAAIVNSGVAFLPALTVQNELAAGSLKVIECEGLELTRPLGIIQRRDVSMSRAARSFFELMMKNRDWEKENPNSAEQNVLAKTVPASSGESFPTNQEPAKQPSMAGG
jgi:hypothetical protein